MTGPLGLVVRSAFRRSRRQHAGLTVVVALGIGAALGALLLADRTNRAYASYVRSAEVGRYVLNPGIATTEMDAAIRSFAEPAPVHTDDLLMALPLPPGGVLGALEAADSPLSVWGSTDGRYLAADRPEVTSGRLPSGLQEVFVSDTARGTLEQTVGRRLSVGDEIDVGFWPSRLAILAAEAPEMGPPLGVERLRIAGFGRLADEVLVDALYPKERLILSGDVAARYQCRVALRPDMSDEEARAVVFPDNCSSLYRYYSLPLDGEAVTSRFTAAVERLSPLLPPAIVELGGYVVIGEDRADLDDAVASAVRPTVTTLVAFAAVAALISFGVAALTMVRLLGRGANERRDLWALGASRRDLVAFGAVPLLADAAAGVAGGAVLAAAVSLFGPLGTVAHLGGPTRVVFPGRLVWPVLAVAALGLALAAAASAAGAVRAASPTKTPRGPRRRRRPALGRRLPLTLGVRAAFDGRGPAGGLAIHGASAIAVAVAIASGLFAGNVVRLVGHPQQFGWPWDVLAVSNGGYGEADPDAVNHSLVGHPDVVSHVLLGFEAGTAMGGQPVPTIVGFAGDAAPNLPLIAGRLPTRAGEAVVGAETAQELGVAPDDTVAVRSGLLGDLDMRVVGIATLPYLGQLLADHTAPGRGAFLVVAAEPSPALATFVAIDLRDHADPDAFVTGLGEEMGTWSKVYGSRYVLTKPARAPAIGDVSALREAPLVLGSLLVLGLFVGLAVSVAMGVRERAEDLSVLRSLGATGRMLRTIVHCQVIVTLGIGMVIGIPAGVLAGRAAWRGFAGQLGVVPAQVVPLGQLAFAVLAGQALAALVAWYPAKAAAQSDSAADLRPA